MKEQEEDQEEDKNPYNKQNQNPKINRNQPMHHQRFLQKLPHKHQGSNSTIFVYRSSQGEFYIFKAAQSDRSDRIQSLSNEFKVLQDLGQHSDNQNDNQQNNMGAPQQLDNQNGNNNSDGQNNFENEASNQSNQQQQQILEEVVIEHHPHIVKTYGYRTNFQHENIFYHIMILEFCQNGSLSSALDSMKQIFNPFSCDQLFQTFSLSSSSAPYSVQKLLNQYSQASSGSSPQSPQPSGVQLPHGNKCQNQGQLLPQAVFTTLNLQIHIQVVRYLIKQLVSAISFIHSKGYYHGDIKLANILLDNEFNLKLADFGTTTPNQSAPTSVPKGTAPQRSFLNSGGSKMFQPHIAPEVQRESKNQKYDGQKADIFSLGVALFCLVFNQYPFSNAGAQSFQISLKNAWSQVQFKINYLIHQHPSEDILNLINLLTQMLDENPQKRPTIFEVEESSWVNSTEVISVPEAIKKVQTAQKQENQRILEQLQNKQKQQINQTLSAPNISSQCSSKSEDKMEIEEEKLNNQNNNPTQSKKDAISKEHYLIRHQEAKERQEKENLHTQPSLKVQEKETTLSLQENSSLQNSGEAVD